MAEKIDVEIPSCPICAGKHTYELTLEKSRVMKFIVDLKPSKIRYQRVSVAFTCPTNQEKFRATISIPLSEDESLDGIKGP